MVGGQMAADADTATGDRRTALEALRIALLLAIAVLVVLGVSALMTTPAQAGLRLAASLIGLAGTISAYRAVGRRRRWAATYAVAVLLVWVALDAWQVIFPSQPGQLVIPLGAFVAGAVLLWLKSVWPTVTALLADARPLRPAATLALAASIIAPVFAPRITLADPTQVSPDDLAIRLEVTCESPPAGSTSLGVTATATFTWARQDVLPEGLAGLVGEPRPQGVMLVGAVWSAERPTGNEVNSWAIEPPPVEPWLLTGGTWGPPADAVVTLGGGPLDHWTGQTFPDGASWTTPASIVPRRMAVGQPYRSIWHFTQRSPIPWPAVRLRYVHDYRFAVEAIAGCGETVEGQPAS
jgi:hypothetical protein